MIFLTTLISFALVSGLQPTKKHSRPKSSMMAASKKAQFKKEAEPVVPSAPLTPTPPTLDLKEGESKVSTDTVENPPTIDPLQYTYNPFGKRDPFRSFLLDRSGERASSSDPLLNYDLSKFTLTGILWGLSNPKAIVKDGDGHGHIISRGTRIGRNKGQVARILKEEVVVAEEYRDPLGKLMVSEYSMKLEKEGTKK
jgi:type IV pilus assembly protein PilP